MNLTRWGYGALLVGIVFASATSAAPPRKDINPALLYYQAFNHFPELDDAESNLLGHMATGPVGAEERELAGRFDRSFALIMRARTQKAACDWGQDVADGPDALTPDWLKVRTAVNAGVLRATIALADGEQARMRDELLAVSTLARHAAAGSSLVGTMVQIAADGKILEFISAHFDELKPQTRAELAAGLNGSPQRQTVADAMVNEQTGFSGWLLDKLEGFRAGERDDAKVLVQFRSIMTATFDSEPDLADRIIAASGGTSAGVIRYIRAVEPHYVRSLAIARAPGRDVARETAEFEKAINATTNLLARIVMPNVGKARMKELEFEARLSRLPNKAP